MNNKNIIKTISKIPHSNRTYILHKPMTIHIRKDSDSGKYIINYPEIKINVSEDFLNDAILNFFDKFHILWQHYVGTDNLTLSDSETGLANKLIDIVKEVKNKNVNA